MYQHSTSATLVEYESLDDRAVTAVLARSELEAALNADDSAQLWLEIGLGDDDSRLLAIDLASYDLEELARRSAGDEVLLAFDADVLTSLFDDPDVEGHGFRGAMAVAVAVATGTIAAPAGFAAVPQTADTAATAQTARAAAMGHATPAATAQVAGLAATAQVAKTQAAKAQVAKSAAKGQISRTLVVKSAALKLLRTGLAG